MFPQVGGLATLSDKTLVSGEPIGGPDGPEVCARPEDWEVLLQTEADCEVSPDREHQGERNSVKLLLCSRQRSLPNFVADPALMVKGASP